MSKVFILSICTLLIASLDLYAQNCNSYEVVTSSNRGFPNLSGSNFYLLNTSTADHPDFNLEIRVQDGIVNDVSGRLDIIIYGVSECREFTSCQIKESANVVPGSFSNLSMSGAHNANFNFNSQNNYTQYLIEVHFESFNHAGYNVEFTINSNFSFLSQQYVQPPPFICCTPEFSPCSGDYVVSGWVKVSSYNGQTQTYKSPNGPKIRIDLPGVTNGTMDVEPTGAIIDGWQKIEGLVNIPISASEFNLELISASSGISYFDDIRFFPMDGSMLSYVYDPRTFRLVAELDERNYATFYEYDEEGKLVRIKKETEKGVMTIQENREAIIKQ